MVVGTPDIPQGFQGSVSAKLVKDYADHEVLGKGHFAT